MGTTWQSDLGAIDGTTNVSIHVVKTCFGEDYQGNSCATTAGLRNNTAAVRPSGNATPHTTRSQVFGKDM